jgi:hypothetical protein
MPLHLAGRILNILLALQTSLEAVPSIAQWKQHGCLCIKASFSCSCNGTTMRLCAVCSPLITLQAFIQRAGPEILVQELPPKLEVVVNLAPTSQQMELLTRLMDILRGGRNVLRDTEVSAGCAKVTHMLLLC